jgi:hypothetical protein
VRITVPILFMTACTLPQPSPETDCEERVYALPGDLEGDSASVYVGCDPPDGWVTTAPADETAHTADTALDTGNDAP